MTENLWFDKSELVGFTIIGEHGPVGTAFCSRHAGLFAAAPQLLAVVERLVEDEATLERTPERQALLEAGIFAIWKAKKGEP
jgi:hypothetical protein